MDTPRSKYLPNHTAKVRPKLPLYSTKKSDKTCESKSVTMDDILRSVKTLDDPCNFKKVEKPSAFSRSDGNLKKFQPSSSLDDTDTANPVCRERSVSPEFTEWESEHNDTNTGSKSTNDDDVSPRSPILLSKVSFLEKCLKPDATPDGSSTADMLCNSRRLLSFESPLVTHECLENYVSDTVEDTCPVENVGTEQTLGTLSVITNVDDEGDQRPRKGSVKDDQLSQKPHGETALQCNSPPFGCSQGRFQNEANAALSVFDVSDFLSCPKTATSRGKVPLQSATDPPNFRVPPIPPSKLMDHKVGKRTQEANHSVNRDHEVQSLTSMAATVNTGFTTACGKNICVAEKSLNFASQLLENVIPDDTPCLSQFETAEFDEACSNNFNCDTESHNKNSPFNGEIFSTSRETSSKVEVLPEALNVENLSPFNRNEMDVDFNTPNDITDSLEVQPSSSQNSSLNGSRNSTHSPGTGFCTARGKNVHVSEKSLTFASNLFGSIETDLQPSETGCESTTSNIQSTSPRPIIPDRQQYRKSHCSTPSEKTRAITSTNLQKAKTLFDQCGVVELPEPGLSRTKLGSLTCGDTEKKVPECSSKCAPSIPKMASVISQIGETTGFSTAGGKKVIVSEKSLNFASQLLENMDAGGNLVQEPEVPRVINTKSEPFRKSMFQTASGKVTSVSSESLRKAKNLLDSLDVDPSEGNASSQLQKRFDSNVDNDSKSVNDFCTPENVDLLDNDNELFETIETPSKIRNPCNRGRLNDEVAENYLKQNAERFSQNVSYDSYAELQRSSTVFNDSGITTQMKNCVDSRDGARIHSSFPDDMEASPEKDPSTGPKSPVLLNGSFMGTPSPRRLQLESRKSINSAASCLANERSSIPPSGQKFCARTGSGHKNSTSDAQVTFTFFKPSSVRSPLSDLIDEGVNNQDSSHTVSEISSRKLEKIKKSPKTLNSPKIKEATSFKSAGGKPIEVSDESMNKVKVMFSDVLDEQLKENAEEGCGNMQSVDKVDATDFTKEVTDEFCSPVLLDGSFVEKSGNSHSTSDIDKSNPEDGDKSHIPTVNSPFVAPDKRLLSFENSFSTLVGTQVNIRLTSLKDEMLSSPDWGEFPDLKSSQAALLERQGDTFSHNLTCKKNVSEANVQNKEVEWGEFPEMASMEMCDLEQKKYVSEAKPSHVKKSLPIQTGSEFASHKPRTDKFLLNSSVTIEGVHTKNQIDALHGEDRRKRKSDPNTLQSTSKRPRVSSSPQMSGSPNKLAVRRRIREEQCAIVRSKRIQRIQPSAGKLFTTKKSSCRWQLIDLDDELRTLNVNDVKVPVSKLVIDITSENSADFRFGLSNARPRTVKFVDGDLIADSCLLAYANDDTAGLNEVTTSFLTSPHVDPKLVTNDWIRNHYRWIVWKLACFERTFPQRFGSSCLNVENVLLQLKYRYDREIDMVQRSSFKKMLEGDAAPNKFVCCVAAVKENSLDEGELLLELELSDGWYSMWAIIDSEMVDLINRSVVGIGTKLIVHSAELTNCKEGCDPLKVPSNVKLKISTNSVRRAKWFAKMGFTSNNNPIPALLCSVLPNGGLIGQVTAVVARKYPVIYLCKDGDGKTVFRNERSQALFREQQEKRKSDRAEQVYEQVWKEVQSKNSKRGKSSLKFTSKEIQNLTDPELIFNIVDESDVEFIQSHISADQLGLAMQYKNETMRKINDDVQKVLQVKLSESEPTLKVTKLLKVRLMDFFTEKHALLTIWRPSDEDSCVLREGKTYEFMNLMASGTRDRVLQLSSTRQTIYSSNEMLEPSEDCHRAVTPLHEVDTPGFAPVFGEVDVVGVVVLVKLPEQTRGVTFVYLSDLEAHYLSITFWTSLSVFGCEDLITEGSIISCSNLQWRSVSNQRKIPSVFASEISCFSVSPKEKHLHQGVTELKAKLADKDIEELVSSARSDILQTTGSRDLVSSPAPSALKTPTHKKLKLMTRLAEDAPPLSPIPLTVSTRHVFQNFKSPCRTPSDPGKKQS